MIGWFLFLAAILVLVGIAYLRGKCDGFIAGYNTASPEKKKQYDIKRLRLLVACFHFALAALLQKTGAELPLIITVNRYNSFRQGG